MTYYIHSCFQLCTLWNSCTLPFLYSRHTCVALKITEMLLSECDPQRLQLIANSYLDMLHVMLESPHTDMQIMATNSFVVFAEQEEDGTPYHRQYDFLIHRFAAMSLVPKNRDSQTFHEVRMAGLKGLRGVIKKTCLLYTSDAADE